MALIMPRLIPDAATAPHMELAVSTELLGEEAG